MSDPRAVSASIVRTSVDPELVDRSAYATPRKMIPGPVTVRATASVGAIEANGGTAGPDDEHEDQPYMVGLPDRRHRVLGVLTNAL